MDWTTKPPKQPGTYWLALGRGSVFLGPVHVCKLQLGGFGWLSAGDYTMSPISEFEDEFHLWYGPIQPPQFHQLKGE